jgi:hypothetical protein
MLHIGIYISNESIKRVQTIKVPQELWMKDEHDNKNQEVNCSVLNFNKYKSSI